MKDRVDFAGLLDERTFAEADEAAWAALREEQRRAGRPEQPDPMRLTELRARELAWRLPVPVTGAPLAVLEAALQNNWPDRWYRDEHQQFWRLAMIVLRDGKAEEAA